VQEALSALLGRRIPITGRFDTATRSGLVSFSGLDARALARDRDRLNRIYNTLFTRIASGR
jgi:hypothetical protein